MIAGESGNQLDSIQMDFTARRYDTFSETFTIEYYDEDQVLTEVDLTGALVQMQVKKRKGDGEAVLNMDVAISGNEITISKPSNLMDLAKGKYWYDLEVQDSDGNQITWVEGRFMVVEHVTSWIEVQLVNFYDKIVEILSISTVPKTILSYVIRSILTIETQVVYMLKAAIGQSLSFTSLNSIVKRYGPKWSLVLTIIQVPKRIYTATWQLLVSFVGLVAFNQYATFNLRVFFFDEKEYIDPYKV